ncbi:MAG: fused MFS/spermidine synthase [Deltaproteobacteria bacterium]|nr:fused MFS/spermidine synthase [Deltaproteobacteria bacterium]
MTEGTPGPVEGRAYLYTAAFLTGAATMAAELAGARLVAPFYGTSTPVWALLVGAVLAGLAAGQVVGGRISPVTRTLRPLGGLLVASGALLALLPVVARPLMVGTLTLFHHGSLAPILASALGVTTLLALPVAVLGACGPVVLHHAVGESEGAGPVAGRIYALGTAGSLAGTYLSGLVLVPMIGTRRTLWTCAAALAAVGVAGVVRRTRAAAVLIVLAVAAGALALPGGIVKPRRNVVFEDETTYGLVQVAQDTRARWLTIDEGYAYQSVYPLDGSLALEGVWGWYALAPAFTTTGAPGDVLFLGLAGGSAARAYRALWPEAALTGVEIDRGVVEAGRRFMALPPEVRVVTDDARAWLHRDPDRYDVIVLDAFRFPYVPFQLATVECFRAMEARLAKGGVVLVNVGRGDDGQGIGRPGDGLHDVVDAVAATLAAVFPTVRGADVPGAPNTILVASRHPPALDVGLAALSLPEDTTATLDRLPPLRPWLPEGVRVLTDDHAPVEWLTDRVLLRRLSAMARR